MQLILYQELGKEGYRRFLRAILADRAAHVTTPGLLATLAELRAADWREVLSGWLSSGVYHRYRWEAVPSPPG